MRRLLKKGLITLKELFIDGTKIEANANRYTFVWRGSINYHLAGLLDSIDQLFGKYNAFLQENDYGVKYGLGNAQMFVIEGMDKVREVIEKNRKRKLVKHKKLSNNRIIEIDNCSPFEIRKLQDNLMMIAAGEVIGFVYGKGKRKSALQQLHEELEQCGKRLIDHGKRQKQLFQNRSGSDFYAHERRSHMDIHRSLRYMVVQTAADVNIKPAVCISMMWKKMPKRTKS